jgi:hypothetical protein
MRKNTMTDQRDSKREPLPGSPDNRPEGGRSKSDTSQTNQKSNTSISNQKANQEKKGRKNTDKSDDRMPAGSDISDRDDY